MSSLEPQIIESHGLSSDEYLKIEDALGRSPNLVELGIYSVMWSEHCSYKSSRRHLKKFPTTANWVIQGPGENAGVIDIGDGQAAIFKMESHNHPSFIEPYQGAATGVGGIMRDVFTMGARPVANLNALRFGDPNHEKTKHLLRGAVAGIGGYGNCVGVPTVGGETNFDASYNGNILVNAMTVGIADVDKIFYSAAAGVGSPVVYVGAKTGRDGIHGATMASAEFSEESEDKRPTVQVGDPFTEKLLIEACLELMATDAVIAIQDMGAAGLTSSSVEMASKGGVGIAIDLDLVPLREDAMTAYEIMLSESQERMLMVLKPGHEDKARKIFEKWELDFAVIGTVIEENRLKLEQNGELVADIPVPSLVDDAPNYDRPYKLKSAETKPTLPECDNLEQALLILIGGPHLSSRKWIWRQYDWRVMNDTITGPGSDSALVRVHGTDKALAITCDVTPRYCEADPFEGGKQAVAETWRNITASGALPLAITNCLNFGNPERPEIMGQFVGCIEGIAEAAKILNYPIVSGNVSLYNETDGRAIMPTPTIGGVGLLNNLQKRAQMGFKDTGDIIVLIGKTGDELSTSLFAREILKISDGPPPNVDLALEKKNGDFVRMLINGGYTDVCHDISDGGLAVCLAEMVIDSKTGCHIDLPADYTAQIELFSESQARYVITIKPDTWDKVTELAHKHNVSITKLGETGGDRFTVGDHVNLEIQTLTAAHESWFQALLSV